MSTRLWGEPGPFGLMFATSPVPATVPSLLQSSLSVPAAKNSLPLGGGEACAQRDRRAAAARGDVEHLGPRLGAVALPQLRAVHGVEADEEHRAADPLQRLAHRVHRPVARLVPRPVPSLLHSPWPPSTAVGLEQDPVVEHRETGGEAARRDATPIIPGLMSLTRKLAPPPRFLAQSSRPSASVLAAKKSVPFSSVSSPGIAAVRSRG